jgi:hypothetical protein
VVIIIIKRAAAEISSEEPIVEEVEAIADITKSASKDTTAVYFVKFVIELLDVMGLDKNLRKVTLLWTMLQSINCSQYSERLKARLPCQVLSLYSLELNPIEQLSALVKGKTM